MIKDVEQMKTIIIEEYEESDYEDFKDNLAKISNQELCDYVYPRIDGYINYAYASPNEHEFEKFKLYNAIIEVLNRLKDKV